VQVDDGPGQPAAEGRDHVDEHLLAQDADAEAAGGGLVVPDRRQREPEPRTEDRVGEQHGAGAHAERPPVGAVGAERALEAGSREDGDALAAAGVDVDIGAVDRQQMEHLGDHPGADREVPAAQPEREERRRQRDRGGDEAGERDRRERMDAAVVAEQVEAVGADPDERLLADRDEAGVAGEEVPHLGERKQREELDEVPRLPLARPPGHRHEHAEAGGDDDGAADAEPRAPDDAHGGLRLGLRRRLGHEASARANSPRGRSSSTARKNRWPPRTPQPGEICALTVWAIPSATPPTSVPQSEPRPPMITASKANRSRVGPVVGAKLVRTPRKIPAIATVASEIAIATA